MLAVLGVKGLPIHSGHWVADHRAKPIDRNELLLPEILIADYASPTEDLVNSACDLIWQSGGHMRNPVRPEKKPPPVE